MPFKNNEDKLKYTRLWWKNHPREYEQHKLNCINNRRIAGFRKYVISHPLEIFLCEVGTYKQQREIRGDIILSIMENAKTGKTPLSIFYKQNWLYVVRRGDYINEETQQEA